MQIGFFDESERLERLNELGDPLMRLNEVINWEVFRTIIQRVLRKEQKGQAAGRPTTAS